jgi:hypothetical protein
MGIALRDSAAVPRNALMSSVSLCLSVANKP